MMQADELLYSKEHEWVKFEGDIGVVGITEYAQDSLGDIVFVELPRVGAQVRQFGNVGVIESVKAVSDLFSPIGGEVLEVNVALDSEPALVNREPLAGGWLFKVKVSDSSQRAQLLSATQYDALIRETA